MRRARFYSVIGGCSLCVLMLSASMKFNSINIKQEPWKAPAVADSIKNPYPVTPVAETQGEELYNIYCWSCHGETGYGDGPAAGALGVKPANFHEERIQKQTDGAIYWKMSEGRGNMPPFKEALSAEKRWQLLSYLRKLGKSNP